MKVLKVAFVALAVLLLVWVAFSWFDVIAHNTPTSTSYGQYSPFNIFTLIK